MHVKMYSLQLHWYDQLASELTSDWLNRGHVIKYWALIGGDEVMWTISWAFPRPMGRTLRREFYTLARFHSFPQTFNEPRTIFVHFLQKKTYSNSYWQWNKIRMNDDYKWDHLFNFLTSKFLWMKAMTLTLKVRLSTRIFQQRKMNNAHNFSPI